MATRKRAAPIAPVIDETYLRAVIDGIQFPASRWQLQAWAEYNGASAGFHGVLSRLPERQYLHFREVLACIRAIPTLYSQSLWLISSRDRYQRVSAAGARRNIAG